jgi:hypothetical protein
MGSLILRESPMPAPPPSDRTDEFSFVLQPSAFGIGVFAVHAIARGTPLRLCGDDAEAISREASWEEVPERLLDYCIPIDGERLIRPLDFGRMHLIWYVNHHAEPNAGHRDFNYFALRDISAGEEITIDYNSLGMPDEVKLDYYRRG